eukprot:TRINITY_DN14442_c2_g1_i2.p6 TRINITY_DN14442_c2_g1~~TRINITY_DN14442_c2_g1_i2.p6  ORF type:complete len:100 (+),score=5.87 TRINITY_DN14442_c2_g1_i2:451-750(+)
MPMGIHLHAPRQYRLVWNYNLRQLQSHCLHQLQASVNQEPNPVAHHFTQSGTLPELPDEHPDEVAHYGAHQGPNNCGPDCRSYCVPIHTPQRESVGRTD